MFPASKTKTFVLSLLPILILVSCGGGGGGGSDVGGGEVTSATPNSAITLSWNVPTSVDTGGAMPDLKGYYLYYGISSEHYSAVTDVGNVTAYTLNLAPGTYYFTITAYDSSGEETEFSGEVTKSVG